MHNKLITVTGEELMNAPLTPVRFIVQSLIPQGLHVLVGAPKIGKSWLALWLCLQVAKGEDVWSFKTEKGTALFLCLEDSLNRLQSRLPSITDDAPDNIHFAVAADTIGGGLEEQITAFAREHPDTNFIVIDTLQKVRQASNDNAYAGDYRELSIIKSVADKVNVTILFIHHPRKQRDDEPLYMVSGTTGITGAADSVFVLEKDKRSSDNATLFCSGRDIESRELRLEFTELLWRLISDGVENPAQLLGQSISLLCEFIRSHGDFTGTPTELFDTLKSMGLQVPTANVLSKELLQNQGELKKLGISYTTKRSNGTRYVALSDDSDDKTDIPLYPQNADPVDPAGTDLRKEAS